MDPEHWYPEKCIIRPYRVALQNPEQPITSQEIMKIYAPILRSHFSEFCRGVKKRESGLSRKLEMKDIQINRSGLMVSNSKFPALFK